jgi:hypothetical protein
MYDSFCESIRKSSQKYLNKCRVILTADEQFYLTANMTLNIAKRAKEIFISSEVDEKRQFLGFLLQNCMLDGKKLDFTMRSPFNLLLNNPDSLTMRRR